MEDIEEELVYFVEEFLCYFRVGDEFAKYIGINRMHVGQEVVNDIE